MSSSDRNTQSLSDGRERSMVNLQRTRLVVYLIAWGFSMLLMPTGFVRNDPRGFTWVFLAASTLGVSVHEMYRRRLDRRWSIDLAPWWLGFDVLLVTWLIWVDGGDRSLWFLGYLSNTAAAAFISGRRGAIQVAIANSAAYLLLLGAMGQITGIDNSLYQALGRLAFLAGASFFPLRGIIDLQEKRLIIRRLRTEEALKIEALTRMTEELDRRSSELAETNAQLEEANRLKSQFLANMSHELRTPLNSIIGFTQILLERLTGQVSERQIKFLGNVLSSGQHLLGLINDLLDLSKIEAGHMELFPEVIDVPTLLDGVRNVMKGVSEKKSIEITLDIPAGLPRLTTDAAKLKQILFNLLSNAVKFSPEQTGIVVRVRAESETASPLGRASIRFDVVDHGIGIAPADRDLIFEAFRQADDGLARQHGGTGLGLALVRRLLEIQGGSISLESEPGKGSTFTARLPTDPSDNGAAIVHQVNPPHGEPPAVVPSPRPAGAPKILIVEDDANAYRSLAATLEAAGFTTIHAQRGEDALRLVETENPSLVTLDLVLPGLDGWEVLKEIKSRTSTRDIPIVIVTMVENRELGLALGADDFFVKPVPPGQLVERIGELSRGASTNGARRILVIDDDPQVHELLAEVAGPLGFTISSAYDGASGIGRARAERPAAIILDLMMPGMSGFEVSAALRSDPATAHIPIIVVTAMDLSGSDRSRLEGRIAALFRKEAMRSEALLETIRELVGRRGPDRRQLDRRTGERRAPDKS